MSNSAMTATAPSTPTDQRNGVTVAIGAIDGPLSHGEPLNLWATPDMDEYAYEAVYDASRISLADAEQDVRTQLAEHNVHVAAFLNEDDATDDPDMPARIERHVDRILTALREAKPTAAQRGADWMLRWGCTPDCTTDHDAPNASEWHTTAPVETEMRDIDASSSAAENAQIPFLAARVVVINDKPQAYGRETCVWLDYGRTTGELSPAEARHALEAMRGFVTDFAAVVEHAERTAVDDFKGDPEIARLDEEATTRRIRAITEATA